MSRRTGAIAALITAVVLVVGCGSAAARPQSAYAPYSGPLEPVAVPESTPAPSEAPGPSYGPEPSYRALPVPTPVRRAVGKRAARPASPPPRQPIRVAHRLAGLASWYCRPGVSVCPVGVPPSGMYAAACAPLRAAMGPSWRGRTVWVDGLAVVLVDYCASTAKTIDLFWSAMRRLGGTGVLRVEVRW